MNLFSFIKKKFLYRFIIVTFSDLMASVCVFDVKNEKVLASDCEEFELESKDNLGDELVSYINAKQEQVERSYVVTLLNGDGQGIVPTCATSKFKEYSVDKRYIYNVCVEKKFSNYVSKIDIRWIQKLFSKTGVDLIYSPYLVLYKLSKTINTEDKIVLYMMQVNQTITLLIKNNTNYVYGNFINLSVEKNLLYSDYENNDEDIEIEEEFEIEDDLDSDEWASDESDSSGYNDINNIEKHSSFSKFLSNSLHEFYKDDKFDGDFIDKVVFFSEDKVDKSLLEYMENELFLSVDMEDFELDSQLLEICEDEVINA